MRIKGRAVRKPRAPTIRSDPFLFFKDAALEKFDFLVRDYGFKVIACTTLAPECVITYRNSTTNLVVAYERESDLWVTLEPIGRPAIALEGTQRIGLDSLIAVRCPGMGVRKNRSPEGWTDKHVERMLSGYAAALTGCASDLVGGDFTVLPKVQQYAATSKLRRERILYRDTTEDAEDDIA